MFAERKTAHGVGVPWRSHVPPQKQCEFGTPGGSAGSPQDGLCQHFSVGRSAAADASPGGKGEAGDVAYL